MVIQLFGRWIFSTRFFALQACAEEEQDAVSGSSENFHSRWSENWREVENRRRKRATKVGRTLEGDK